MTAAPELDGRVALVTGAARGQGRAHAVRLAQAGADVVAVDVCAPIAGVPYPPSTEDDVQVTVAQIEATGRRATSLTVDIRDATALTAGVDLVIGELGRLDVVVANAGVCLPGTWDELTQEQHTTTVDVNVTGTWNTIRATAPHLIESGGGSIVITSSVAGLKVQPFMIPYTTSKFALTGMAKAFAAELARHGIRVNSVHPNQVNTPMGVGLAGSLSHAFSSNPELTAMFTPMKPDGILEAEEVAETVLFLVSDRARHITAQALAVDSGLSQF